MSSLEQIVLNGNHGGGSYPDCPGCKGPMRVSQLSPMLRASDGDEVIYACLSCGSEVKRNVKRHSQAQSSQSSPVT